MKNENILTAQEVADQLRIAKNTVYELVKRGELKCCRVGSKFRFEAADVEAYKRSMRDAGPPAAAVRAAVPASVPAVLSPQAEAANAPEASPAAKRPGSFVLCGQDLLLDVLARRLEAHPAGCRVLRSYQGSYNGLHALYLGEADAATAHLWDGATASYNVPYLRYVVPGTPLVVRRLARRRVGFYVPAGNPRGLASWADLGRPGLVLANRERGAGIRVLVDERLRELGIAGEAVPGYGREYGTHLAAAGAVSRGGADYAVGNEKACALVKGVDFVPLQEECYDIAYRRSDAALPVFRALAEILVSPEFREELESLGGYDLSELGTELTV